MTILPEDIFSLKNGLNLLFQFLIGFLTGLFLNLLFEIFVAAGQILSTQFGFGLVSLLDPRLGMISSLTQFYTIMISLVFLAMDGHLLIIKMIVESFQYLPIDHFYIPAHLIMKVLNYAGVIFSGSIMIAMILVLCILLTNISLAVMTKFAPQFNLFSIGINMTMVIGLVSAYITYDLFVDKGFTVVQEAMTILQHLLTSAGHGR
jgi:flagellar biosynthesis protein FliR